MDLDGNVCLNILREDWKPVLNLNSVMVGLQYLFLEPNADDPLNKEAAEDLRKDRAVFASNVRRSLGGGAISKLFLFPHLCPIAHTLMPLPYEQRARRTTRY